MRQFIFDVDGTLTPSRGRMDSEFKKYFMEFARNNFVYIVTGSDYNKTWEQLGEALVPIQISYNCSGNSVWVNGTEIHTRDWTIRDDMRGWLEKQLKESRFYRKTGNHIEERPGLVNFSIVGRNCNLEERAMYVEWDEHKSERKTIAQAFNKTYTKDGIIAQVAGETGIDITPIGAGKAQILQDFDTEIDELIFFGDKCEKGGNDHDIAQAVGLFGTVHAVTGWEQTYEIMKGYWNV